MPTILISLLVLVMLPCSTSPVMAADNEPPYADAGRDMTVAVGEVVSFHGDGIDSDGRIDLYEWDFDGDGLYDWSHPDHGDSTWSYQSIGDFNATLRVTDNDDDTDTDLMVVTVVTGNDPPTADAGDDMKVHAQELAEFKGSGDDPDGHIAKYEWDFDGDGTYDWNSDETGETSWIYTVPDTYYAVFMVTDDGVIPANDTATIKVVVYPANRPPLANAGSDVTVHAKQTFRLQGEGTDIDGRIVKYEWDFNGDGIFDRESSSTGEAMWSYDKPGQYTAVLKVTDNAELPSTGTDSLAVHVLAENKVPTANAGSDVTAKIGDMVSFNGAGTDDDGDIVEYKWDFDNDGTFDWSSAENGKTYFIYQTAGTYQARLMVIDDVGATANSTMAVVIKEEKKEDDDEPPLLQFNLNFIIALIVGLGIGLGIGIGIAFVYLKHSIASKYRKVKELEGGGSSDEDADFRGARPGEREPPVYRGGDTF